MTRWVFEKAPRKTDPLEEYEPEAALLTRVIESGKLIEVIRNRWISGKTFANDEHRGVFEYIRKSYEDNGTVPSLTRVRQRHPDFKVEETADDTVGIIEALKEQNLYRSLQMAVKRVGVEARINASEALSLFQEEAATIALRYTEGHSEDVTKSGEAVLRQYRRMKYKKGLLGAPWPWDRMNVSTGGILRGSLNAIYGPPGTMKTWLLIAIGDHVHRNGGRPVFFTYEMPVEDIRFRWACLRAKVDYEKVRAGQLRKSEEKQFFRAIEEWEGEQPFIVEELDSVGPAGLVEIRSKLTEHNATLGLVDGLGQLVEDAEWGSFWTVTKGLKRIAQSMRVGIVATHHANRSRKEQKRGSTDASDVALGDTLQRDADVLVRLWRTPENVEVDELGLEMKKVREGRNCYVMLNALPAYDFSQKRVEDGDGNAVTNLDGQKRKGEDEDGDGIVGKVGGAKGRNR